MSAFDGDPPTYEISIPAKGEQLGLARLFVAAVLRGSPLGDHAEDVIDDAKLAVSELVTAVIEGGAVDRVSIKAWAGAAAGISVAPWNGVLEDEDFGPYAIVEALFPGTEVVGGAVVVPVGSGAP